MKKKRNTKENLLFYQRRSFRFETLDCFFSVTKSPLCGVDNTAKPILGLLHHPPKPQLLAILWDKMHDLKEGAI